MSRPLMPVEKVFYNEKFPWLKVDQVVVTAEVDTNYNCIAWSVGNTHCWLWPGYTQRAFDAFYRRHYLVPAEAGPVVLWQTGPDDRIRTRHMIHACTLVNASADRWESKTGGLLRIQHDLHDLESIAYGWPIRYYRPMTEEERREQASATKERDGQTAGWSDGDLERIRRAANKIPEGDRVRFAESFKFWKQSWFGGDLAINSDPRSRASGPDFMTLVGMGKAITPLVVDALTQRDNFFALQLYLALRVPDARLETWFTAPQDDEPPSEGEQGKARNAVREWLANTQ